MGTNQSYQESHSFSFSGHYPHGVNTAVYHPGHRDATLLSCGTGLGGYSSHCAVSARRHCRFWFWFWHLYFFFSCTVTLKSCSIAVVTFLSVRVAGWALSQWGTGSILWGTWTPHAHHCWQNSATAAGRVPLRRWPRPQHWLRLSSWQAGLCGLCTAAPSIPISVFTHATSLCVYLPCPLRGTETLGIVYF